LSGARDFLETDVVSEPKPARRVANVVTWFERQSADRLYLTSTVIAAELAFGIEILPPGRRRRGCEIRLHERAVRAFRGRVLAFDETDALLDGHLMARGRRHGRPARVSDAQVAATALRHGLAIATRKTGGFALFDAR
jgi:toxin FitB